MKQSPQKIFDLLKGAWSFRRIISYNGVVKGKADFTEIKPAVIHYQETGQWTHQGQIFQVSKEYQYRYDPQADKITVYFVEDGKADRVFHDINLTAAKEENAIAAGIGEHQCAADHYKAHYHFFNPDKFSISYKVKGPKKDYSSETVFERT